MATQSSFLLPLGSKAIDFNLLEPLTSKIISLHDVVKPHGLVIAFLCNHCPYVKHINDLFIAVASHYLNKDIGFVAINSNDVNQYPEDSPSEMAKVANSYPFPYVYDESQETAKAYQAVCTPDFFVFSSKLHLVYSGRFDASRPHSNIPVTGNDLQTALEHLLSPQSSLPIQYPSIGCSIKWKR